MHKFIHMRKHIFCDLGLLLIYTNNIVINGKLNFLAIYDHNIFKKICYLSKKFEDALRVWTPAILEAYGFFTIFIFFQLIQIKLRKIQVSAIVLAIRL